MLIGLMLLLPWSNKAAGVYCSRRPRAIELGNFKTPIAESNSYFKEKSNAQLALYRYLLETT